MNSDPALNYRPLSLGEPNSMQNLDDSELRDLLQQIGQNFDFAGEFIAFQDMGEGKVKALRTYPVSIVGIQKTPVIRGAIEGVGDQVKHGFSSIFGH